MAVKCGFVLGQAHHRNIFGYDGAVTQNKLKHQIKGEQRVKRKRRLRDSGFMPLHQFMCNMRDRCPYSENHSKHPHFSKVHPATGSLGRFRKHHVSLHSEGHSKTVTAPHESV